MKIFTILILTATFCFVQKSNATSVAPNLGADLKTVELDQDYYKDLSASGGKIEINPWAKTLKLTISVSSICPEGFSCAAVMPPPIKIELRDVKISKNFCKETIYEARHNGSEYDGEDFQVTVTDYTTSNCDYYMAMPETQIELETGYYDQIEGLYIKGRSKMTATKLINIFPSDIDFQDIPSVETDLSQVDISRLRDLLPASVLPKVPGKFHLPRPIALPRPVGLPY
jgi:hypothetical protein